MGDMAPWATHTELISRRTLHYRGSPAWALLLLCMLAGLCGCVGHNPWKSSTKVRINQPALPSQVPQADFPLRPPAPSQLISAEHSGPYHVAPVGFEQPANSQVPVLSDLDTSKFLPAISEAMQGLAEQAREAGTIPAATLNRQPSGPSSRLVPTAGPQRMELALAPPPLSPDAVRSDQGLVTVSVRDTPLHSLLAAIAEQQGLSIVVPASLATNVTVSLRPTTLESALDAIMAISNCTWTVNEGVIYVTPVDKESPQNYLVQGRVLKVFNLNYISAKDVEAVVTGLLSPVGAVFSRETAVDNKLKAVEQVVVEDLPSYVARIADYVEQVDRAPLQALVEVRILQVKLSKDNLHGVNFEQLARSTGPEVWLKTQTFSKETNPGAIFTVGGSHFNKVLDLLATTLDSKTLAAPRLLMINGQESKIQIGSRLAFSTSTTTQTTTVEAVQFLDVGTVLSVTPQIGENGHIVMQINPKVSQGEIDPVTQLPNEDTTELSTTIMVPDGHGVIIGGLIQESDVERQSKVPLLGDLWVVGRLFQRRSVERERVEVVVALLPRIVSCNDVPSQQDYFDLQRIDLPLLTPELQSSPRPEPSLPDAIRKPLWPKSWR